MNDGPMLPGDCRKHDWKLINDIPGFTFIKIESDMTWEEFRRHISKIDRLECRHCGKREWAETEVRWVDNDENQKTKTDSIL